MALSPVSWPLPPLLPRRFHGAYDLLSQPLDRLLLGRGDRLARFGDEVRRAVHGDQFGR